MGNKYYQKHKERLQRYQNLSEEEKEKGVSIIKNVSRSYLSIEEIII